MFACHVPVDVVDVAAVVLLDGVAFSATQVVPPSPLASKTKVLPEALVVTVSVTPPACGSTDVIRQLVPVVVQVAAAALRDCFCCARARLDTHRIRTAICSIFFIYLLPERRFNRFTSFEDPFCDPEIFLLPHI
jgi:hypothetical protein